MNTKENGDTMMLLYKILASYCLLMKLCDFQAIEVLIQYVQA